LGHWEIEYWQLQANPGETLYYCFREEEFKGDWDEIEEIQMNIRSKHYPPEILITFKELSRNPDDENMPKWISFDSYWYLIAYHL
jgi:hypothetical protein